MTIEIGSVGDRPRPIGFIAVHEIDHRVGPPVSGVANGFAREVGCGVIVILVFIVMAGGAYLFKTKVVDPFKKNPGMALAKGVVAANPDLGKVLTDDSGGRALPVWLNGPEGHSLFRGDGDHPHPEPTEVITAGPF